MRCAVHFNFGGGNGAASNTVFDSTGREMPFTFGYNTQEKWRGFLLPGVKPVMNWKELQAIWPTWIGRARAKQKNARLSEQSDSDGRVQAIR
jgi:hypothetical protein